MKTNAPVSTHRGYREIATDPQHWCLGAFISSSKRPTPHIFSDIEIIIPIHSAVKSSLGNTDMQNRKNGFDLEVLIIGGGKFAFAYQLQKREQEFDVT